jgi:hypothetical protein
LNTKRLEPRFHKPFLTNQGKYYNEFTHQLIENDTKYQDVYYWITM